MSDCPSALNVVQMLLFYPRGGSAQVIRYMTSALPGFQVHCRIVTGSLGAPGEASHAGTFFSDLDMLPVDYTPALDAWERGEDPLAVETPLHPSFEDRTDVPDRTFTAVTPELGGYLESRWAEMLGSIVSDVPDLFHVHHVSPLQAAVRANWPDVPVIGHIHGTELKMLEGIRTRAAILEQFDLDFDHDPATIEQAISGNPDQLDEHQQRVAQSTRWSSWRYACHWQQRFREYAGMCDRLIVLTDDASERAAELLGYDPAGIYPVPNGVDIDLFTPDRLSPEERLARWRHWLVEDPRGWDESGVPGSVRYRQAEVDEWFVDDAGEQTPVLFYVGRFTSMKRVPLLIRAYKRAQSEFRWRAPLVIWGGSPGEWEREHPVAVARQEQVPGVFFVGWRGHEELPQGLNAADVMVAPSRNEPFGQVYLEAMGCALPVIATLSGGPPSFINQKSDAPDGWLIPPDDEDALARVLVEVVNNPDERRRRGQSALEAVRSAYSWRQVAGTVREIYDDLLSTR